MLIFNKKEKTNMENYDFNIKFNKHSHEIQAGVYAQALISTDIILREIGKSKNLPELVLEVKTQNEGSFDVLLGIVAIAAEAPVLAGAIGGLSQVISTYINLIDIKKILAGNEGSTIKLDGDNNYVITGSNNTIITGLDYPQEDLKLLMTNQLVNDALSNNFSAISKDQSIDSLKISDLERSTEIPQSLFSSMSDKVVIPLADTKEALVSAELTISKLVLDKPSNKWTFIYQGQSIQATIEDDEFWQSVFAGEKFGYGEKLIADLKIKREYDSRLRTHVNKEYIVEKVHDHIVAEPDLEQLTMGLH